MRKKGKPQVRKSDLTKVDAEYSKNRGIAWFKKGDYDRAIDDCTRALEIAPRFCGAYSC